MRQDLSQFFVDQPKYQRLAEVVARTIRVELHGLIPEADVSYRAKAADRLLEKTMKGIYREAGADVRDLAGVRIIVAFAEEVAIVEAALADTFEVLSREDKRVLAQENALTYRGTHLEVALRESHVAELGDSWFAEKVCEVQIHTRAETLWAGISHQLLYKPFAELSRETKRSIARLLALVELFDSEVSRARDELLRLGLLEHESNLAVFEDNEFESSARVSNGQLSKEVLRQLVASRDELPELHTENDIAAMATKNRLGLGDYAFGNGDDSAWNKGATGWHSLFDTLDPEAPQVQPFANDLLEPLGPKGLGGLWGDGG